MGHNWTFDRLVQSATSLNPKSRGRNYPYVPKFEIARYTSGVNTGKPIIVPFKGTNSILISLKAWGVTQSSLHNISLLFSDVDIQTEDPNNRNYFQIESNGQIYWIQKLNRSRNPLTCRCSCCDFFYSFAFYNYNVGHCLYGPAPRPYQRKTNRPPRNPQHRPGICKHIYHAWDVLRNSGFTIN